MFHKNDLRNYVFCVTIEIPLRNVEGQIILSMKQTLKMSRSIIGGETRFEVHIYRWQLHHFIFGKPSGGNVIDHINGNGCRCNLRENLHAIHKKKTSEA